LTDKLLTSLKQKITGLRLVPAGGGCFELSVNGELVYSKLQTREFPDESWVLAEISKRAKK
jgi:selenoprotein W-related protein